MGTYSLWSPVIVWGVVPVADTYSAGVCWLTHAYTGTIEASGAINTTDDVPGIWYDTHSGIARWISTKFLGLAALVFSFFSLPLHDTRVT